MAHTVFATTVAKVLSDGDVVGLLSGQHDASDPAVALAAVVSALASISNNVAGLTSAQVAGFATAQTALGSANDLISAQLVGITNVLVQTAAADAAISAQINGLTTAQLAGFTTTQYAGMTAALTSTRLATTAAGVSSTTPLAVVSADVIVSYDPTKILTKSSLEKVLKRIARTANDLTP